MMDRKYDIVVFGATGRVGKFVVEELINFTSLKPQYRWAIAGRSKSRLKSAFEEAKSYADVHSSYDVDTLECDVNDETSLKEMALTATVILNCVGPFHVYGEPVVKACVSACTHYLDVSGEPQHLGSILLKYDTLAQENNIFVIGGCGYGYLGSEIGVIFLEKHFPDIQWNEVESFVSMDHGPKGFCMSVSTVETELRGLPRQSEMKELRKKICADDSQPPVHKQVERSILSFDKGLNCWLVSSPGIECSIVQKSRDYLHEKEGVEKIQYASYFQIQHLYNLFITIVVAAVVSSICYFGITRRLFRKYPRLFSFGYVTSEGPSREDMDKMSFCTIFTGKGWLKSDKASSGPNVSKTVELKGPEGGYITTAKLLVYSGITVLEDRDKMPAKGGVLTPGAAFHHTNIIDRIQGYSSLRFIDKN